MAAFLVPLAALAAPAFPPLTGRVVDAANIIPADEEARLTQKLAQLETQSQRQLVVATIPSLGGYEISDYGYQLGRAWGIGDKGRNDGALLIVAPNERKVRIEVGYGLEGVLTDGMSFLIVNQRIVPRFKQGDFPGGIEAGTDALIQQLSLPADEAQKVAQAANARASQARQGGGGFPLGAVLPLIFIGLFVILPMLRGGRRGGRRGFGGGLAPIILWDAMSHMGGRGGGGWGGGGGFGGGGGGGFGGGGGSFGGGGSSGSW
ncbi:MAG: TPM domain-containing protein [Novosphingobium sp.]